MGSKRSAILLALLMLGAVPVLPAGAEQVTHFGNAGFPSTVRIVFGAAGWDTSTNLTLGANGVVSAANLDVDASAVQGTNPATIGIDVGDDGDLEWFFGGAGNGSFGHVDELSSGWGRVARPPGLEPGTAGLEIRCSIQLSYGRTCRVSIAFRGAQVVGGLWVRGARCRSGGRAAHPDPGCWAPWDPWGRDRRA